MAQAQDPIVIKIASQSPLSGGQAVLGVGLRNGTELAIEQLSGPLEEMGFDIQFVPFDDQATPDVGVANAQQIVADPAILAVIGHFNSGVAIPSSEVYVQNDLVMVSPANTNVNVTDRGLATVNRVCGRDDAQGAVGADFIANLEGVSSVYILHDTTAYGQGVAEFVRDMLADTDVEVLGFEGTEERSNFDGIIQPILALAPDLIYMGGIYDQFGIFVNQAAAAGYAGIYMGPDGLDSPDYALLAGDAATGTYYTSAAGPAAVFPAAEQLIADYSAAYGDITPYVAESYDATAIVLAAIQRAAEAAGGLPTRAAVSEEVRATENFEGITGTITFDDNGDRQLANYFTLEVGEIVEPADWLLNEAIGQTQLPSPLYAEEYAAMQEAAPEATPEETPAP
jgi:branched-chain amino acid transport system substrate-binding protein